MAAPKKATAKKAAAKKSAAQDPAVSGSADDKNASQPDFDGNSGPGTGSDAPDDQGPEYPTTQITGDAESGPIVPTDAKTQVLPAHGYADSSTDDTYAAAGGRTIAGENHVGLEDEDGNSVSAGDLFEDGDEALLTVKHTVVQRFTYQNSPDHEETRLLLNKGQKVSRRQADLIQASLERNQEPRFAEHRETAAS